MEMADRFKYSAQAFAYVPKPVKKRLLALRKIDSRRYSESVVIQRCLDVMLPEIEREAASFRVPAQDVPGRKIA